MKTYGYLPTDSNGNIISHKIATNKGLAKVQSNRILEKQQKRNEEILLADLRDKKEKEQELLKSCVSSLSRIASNL